MWSYELSSSAPAAVKPIVNPRLQVKVNLKSRLICDIFLAMSTLLTISEVSRRSGVAASALRFYEEKGLIKSERAGSGHRRFPRAVLRRIAFIVFAQRLGMTLEEIGKELRSLPQDRAPEGSDWAEITTA